MVWRYKSYKAAGNEDSRIGTPEYYVPIERHYPFSSISFLCSSCMANKISIVTHTHDSSNQPSSQTMVLFGPAGMSGSDSPPSVTSVARRQAVPGPEPTAMLLFVPHKAILLRGGYPLGTPLAVEVYINIPPIQRRVNITNISI